MAHHSAQQQMVQGGAQRIASAKPSSIRRASAAQSRSSAAAQSDVRGEISPSECGTDHLAALVPLHPVEGTTKRELFIEAKFTSFKGYLSGKHRRLAVRIWFRTDPTGTLVIVTIVLLSARCMVQLARAGSEMQAGYWIASVVWNPPSESLGRAEVRLLRCMLSKGWFAVGLIGINRPGDASVPLSQVY